MILVYNPSPDQIRDFCADVQEKLLDAAAKRMPVAVGFTVDSDPVADPEYGMAVIDRRYMGGSIEIKIEIKVGRPATIAHLRGAAAEALSADPSVEAKVDDHEQPV